MKKHGLLLQTIKAKCVIRIHVKHLPVQANSVATATMISDFILDCSFMRWMLEKKKKNFQLDDSLKQNQKILHRLDYFSTADGASAGREQACG